MHTHLDDGDWQAAIRRYKESTALPAEYLVPALSQLREKFNDTGEELRSAGPSLQQVIREAGVPADESFDPQQDWINQDTDACSLIEKVRSRNVSVIDVVERHLRMAAIAQQILGCYSEIFFDGARARAKEIDKRIQAGQDCGRLCGLPISIKAHQSLNGSGSDRGFVFDVLDPITVQSLIEEETKSGAKGISKSTLRLLDMQGPHTQVTTSAQIKALLDEGAIIIAKTVMPQSVMQLDTKSNLHGQCLNPYNVHLSPGGSSGGESASVSSGSTMMGIGSDIGGSVRQPAAVTGLYGIRCTTGRIGLDGVRTTMPGNQGIPATIGPLCRSRRDLRLVTEILISRTIHVNPFTTPPLPWRKVEAQTPSKRKLRVGILRDDGVALPITPIRRALEHAIVKLSGVDSVELIYCPQDDIYGRGWDLTREL
jgi:amidase